MDRHSAPIGLGVVVVATLFGIVGGSMLWVMWDFELVGAAFGGVCVADVAATVLWRGGREPLPGPTGPRDLSPAASGADEINVAAGSTSPPAAAPSPCPEPTPATSEAPKAAPEPAADATDTPVKSSTTLAGETELAERKGEWSYKADGADESSGSEVGTRPAALDGPRDGNADDLKQIKGVGPKLEKLCNSLGFYHFDQIAGWTEDEVAWVDENLEGFKGRVSRDEWVSQAKVLAEGGITEFSDKVEKGEVY